MLQAFPSGLADSVVQVLSSVSRVASLNDISKWNITKIDTLAALMTTSDGPWDAAKVQCREIKTTKHQNLESALYKLYTYLNLLT